MRFWPLKSRNALHSSISKFSSIELMHIYVPSSKACNRGLNVIAAL
jgi:hypothetical protein